MQPPAGRMPGAPRQQRFGNLHRAGTRQPRTARAWLTTFSVSSSTKRVVRLQPVQVNRDGTPRCEVAQHAVGKVTFSLQRRDDTVGEPSGKDVHETLGRRHIVGREVDLFLEQVGKEPVVERVFAIVEHRRCLAHRSRRQPLGKPAGGELRRGQTEGWHIAQRKTTPSLYGVGTRGDARRHTSLAQQPVGMLLVFGHDVEKHPLAPQQRPHGIKEPRGQRVGIDGYGQGRPCRRPVRHQRGPEVRLKLPHLQVVLDDALPLIRGPYRAGAHHQHPPQGVLEGLDPL